MPNESIINIKNLIYTLPNTAEPLFTISNFNISKNDKILIKGASGKGKTSLLHIMAGFIKEYSGYVQLFNHDLKLVSEGQLCEIRRSKSSFIFQKINLIGSLSPIENLELVASDQFNIQEAESLLSALGLKNQMHTLASNLSTGEQQRVACARAIFSKPEIIFADEPTSGLDDTNAKKVIDILLNHLPELTLILVSHDHRLEHSFSKIIQFEEIISK